jgi:CMP/dCMP kinase
MPVGCVAIDGPVASGKSTAARGVARRLGVAFVDTGAMYRALTLAALNDGIEPTDEPALLRLLAAMPISVDADPDAELGYRVAAGGRDLPPGRLFAPEVNQAVSTVAAHPGVRSAMVAAQRALARAAPVVMAGRDIGTVVLPDAACKIYLTASVEARVARRAAELSGSGSRADEASLRADIVRRDEVDSTRAVSPLRPAADATIIDSSLLTSEDVVERIVALARRAPWRAGAP